MNFSPTKIVAAGSSLGALRKLKEEGTCTASALKSAGQEVVDELKSHGFSISDFSFQQLRACGPELVTMEMATVEDEMYLLTEFGENLATSLPSDLMNAVELVARHREALLSNRHKSPSRSVPTSRESRCPECGGSPLGRGYNHTDGCSKMSPETAARRQRVHTVSSVSPEKNHRASLMEKVLELMKEFVKLSPIQQDAFLQKLILCMRLAGNQ